MRYRHELFTLQKKQNKNSGRVSETKKSVFSATLFFRFLLFHPFITLPSSPPPQPAQLPSLLAAISRASLVPRLLAVLYGAATISGDTAAHAPALVGGLRVATQLAQWGQSSSSSSNHYQSSSGTCRMRQTIIALDIPITLCFLCR